MKSTGSNRIRLLCFCVLLTLVAMIFWFGKRLENTAGIPAIKADVTRQLADMQVQFQSLKGISIGPISFTHALGEPPLIKGYCVFNAKQNSSIFELRVYW